MVNDVFYILPVSDGVEKNIGGVIVSQFHVGRL